MGRDVIAAVATAPGRGGIGVVRVSGPSLADFAGRLLGRLPSPRRATLTDFPDARGVPIDRGIALYFPAPHSYTGEDVLELQGHGGDTVLALVLERCVQCGARLAEPGEFTRRAFLAGRIDLAQAEAVADLIEAGSAQAARSAMRSLSGEFSRRVEAMIERLTELRALIEAYVDFPEEDIDRVDGARIAAMHDAVEHDLEQALRAAGNGRLLVEGIQVALIGPPNVGKSSLLNRLAGDELAIVTAIPGTTRDLVRGTMRVRGVPIHLVDTAGLRETEDPIERVGMARSRTAAAQADVVLDVRDAADPETTTAVARIAEASGAHRIEVLNKVDLTGEMPGLERGRDPVRIRVSALDGRGIDALESELLRLAGWAEGDSGVFSARARHLEALRDAAAALRRAREVGSALELYAEELRLAQNALRAVGGSIAPDDLLGVIFARFCIGK